MRFTYRSSHGSQAPLGIRAAIRGARIIAPTHIFIAHSDTMSDLIGRGQQTEVVIQESGPPVYEISLGLYHLVRSVYICQFFFGQRIIISYSKIYDLSVHLMLLFYEKRGSSVILSLMIRTMYLPGTRERLDINKLDLNPQHRALHDIYFKARAFQRFNFFSEVPPSMWH